MRIGLGLDIVMLAATQSSGTPTPAPASTFASPTATIYQSPTNRVGWGADLCGYLGSNPVTISGPDAAKYQWFATVGTGSAPGGGTRTINGLGLAPKNGANAFGTAWGLGAETSHTVILTDSVTGDTCTVTSLLTLNAYTDTNSGMVYTNTYTVIVASDIEYQTAYTYIRRTATGDGQIIIRRGVYLFPYLTSSANQFPSMQTTLGGDSGFTPVAPDQTIVAEPGSPAYWRRRRIKGPAGNFILVRAEVSLQSGFMNLIANKDGVKFKDLRFPVVNPTGVSNQFTARIQSNDVCWDGCEFDGTTAPTDLNKQALTVYGGAFPRRVAIINCYFHHLYLGSQTSILDDFIGNSMYRFITSDSIDLSRNNSTFTTGYSTSATLVYNVLCDQDTATGHPDAVQFFMQGTVSPTDRIEPGQLTFQYNIVTQVGAQGFFGGGGTTTSGRMTLMFTHNVMVNKYSSPMTAAYKASVTIDKNTVLWDVGDPVTGSAQQSLPPVGGVDSSTVDMILTNNLCAEPLAVGTWTNTGIKTWSNNSSYTRTSLAAVQALVNNFPTGGMAAVTAPLVTIDDISAAVIDAVKPKVDTAGWGALKADGSWNV